MTGWLGNLHGWAIGCVSAAIFGRCAIVLAQDSAGTEPPAGIRQLASKHLALYTDLPSQPEIDALPTLFDQAFGQWCAYFGVDEQQHVDWHVRAYLMKTREPFQAAGLLPADLPNFNGYARGDQIWLRDQTSVYYRRHLLLHEGTHSFMLSRIGGMGPSWFAEGMAELLATHRLEDGKLTLNYFPRQRDEVPKLGRIEIVQTGYASHRAVSLAKLFAYDHRGQQENQWYGWCWAAAAFLDSHPRYRARFRQLHKLVGDSDDHFNQQVMKIFVDDWTRLNEDWQLFVANLDYGYDFQKMDVEFTAGEPLGDGGQAISVAADRSWQSSGVRLEAGQSYRLRALGRYQVASEPRTWWCEPGGVTIRYYHGQPLGILLAAVRADDPIPQSPSGLLKPIVVGLGATLKIEQAGTLYLRINDSADSLGDNAGSLTVKITRGS
ncbi:MAG: hypothetical protein HY288_11900 [Planctomycetia bacterium]|nr:hypothetical protein [Planctomycetia bacterium]